MDYLIILVCGFWLGMIFAANRIRKQIYNIAKEQGIAIDEGIESKPKIQKIPFLTVEKHGDFLYLFNTYSNSFMCQGKTVEELAEKLSTIQNINIANVRNGNDNVWFVNGKVSSNPNEN